MKLWKKIFIFGLIPSLFALTTAAFYLAEKKSGLSQLGNSQPQSVSALSVILKANPPAVKAGDKLVVNVLIAGNFADSVSAADLQLSYPADMLKFIDSRPGDIWTKAIKLKDEANPQSGSAHLSIGKGIAAEITASPVLAIFEFQVLSSYSAGIKLELENSTRFARLGGGSQPVPYQTVPMMISAN